MRFTVSPEAKDELLDRLLELNHERYADGGSGRAARQEGEEGAGEARRRLPTRIRRRCCERRADAGRAAGRARAAGRRRTCSVRRIRMSSCRAFGAGAGVVPGRDAGADGHDRRPEPRRRRRPARTATRAARLVRMTGRRRWCCSRRRPGSPPRSTRRVTSLTVSASWGRYEKIDNPDPTATGAVRAVVAAPPGWRIDDGAAGRGRRRAARAGPGAAGGGGSRSVPPRRRAAGWSRCSW